MTSPTNEQQRVDVLAVMTEYIADCEYEMRNAETAKYEALCKKSMDKAKQARAAVAELIDAAQRADKLVNLVTVRQVIKAGNEEIEAAGLNPWCINEGLADGNETIGFWRLSHALANVGAHK